jgi:sulfur-oxidizing protein SoxY
VAQVQFGPRSARPQIQTRIRLATSQTLIALAELADGSIWRRQVRVLVTLAACVEGG